MDIERIKDQGYEILLKFGGQVVGAIALVFIAWTIARWASSMLERGLRRRDFDETLTIFFGKLVYWLILLLAVLGCLGIFGVETTSFAAVIGAAGIAIGLALQGTLSNFAAGFMLLIFRPFKVGDVINVAGQLGTVRVLDLFTTSIDTFDNRRIIIPNASVFGNIIENITYHQSRRVDVAVGTDYSADLDQTRDVLLRAATRVEKVLDDPEPAVVLLQLGGSSIDWSVRAWAARDDFLEVKQALLRSVKQALDEAQIGIPFPQMDVHLDAPWNASAAEPIRR